MYEPYDVCTFTLCVCVFVDNNFRYEFDTAAYVKYYFAYVSTVNIVLHIYEPLVWADGVL